MKTPTTRSSRGFTLVELLVVIAIIVVLAAAGFQAGNFAINKARKVKALAVCTELEKGVNNFYEDNGTMPLEDLDDAETVVIESNSNEGLEMLEILLDQEDGNAPFNGQGIRYINIKEGTGSENSGSDGLILDADGIALALFDPWGGEYYIAVDGDLNETIEVQPDAANGSKTLQRRVAVWSNGGDWEDDDPSVRDDVTTW